MKTAPHTHNTRTAFSKATLLCLVIFLLPFTAFANGDGKDGKDKAPKAPHHAVYLQTPVSQAPKHTIDAVPADADRQMDTDLNIEEQPVLVPTAPELETQGTASR